MLSLFLKPLQLQAEYHEENDCIRLDAEIVALEEIIRLIHKLEDVEERAKAATERVKKMEEERNEAQRELANVERCLQIKRQKKVEQERAAEELRIMFWEQEINKVANLLAGIQKSLHDGEQKVLENNEALEKDIAIFKQNIAILKSDIAQMNQALKEWEGANL